MNHYDSMAAAARELGVEICGPSKIRLPSGRVVYADTWFPDLGQGAPMLVVSDYERIEPFQKELVELGYGYSTFDPPRGDVPMSVDNLRRLLRDWAWTEG